MSRRRWVWVVVAGEVAVSVGAFMAGKVIDDRLRAQRAATPDVDAIAEQWETRLRG